MQSDTCVRAAMIFLLAHGLLCAHGFAWAAKKPQPPSEDIKATPFHRLVIVKVEGVEGSTAIMRVLDRVAGEPGDQRLSLVLDQATADQIGIDERYLIAYTDGVKTRYPAEGYQRGEPRIIRNLVAGEIISGSSPAAIAMLDGTAARKFASEPAAHLDFLLSLLQTSDAFLSRLAGADMLARPELLQNIDDSQAARVLDVFGHHNGDPATRSIALAIAQSPSFPKEQLTDRAVDLLRDTPVSVVSSHVYWPALIRSTLLTLDQQAQIDHPVLEKWLSAGHRGVVEAALRTIGALKPEMELTIVHRVLGQPFLPRSSRQILQQRIQVLSKR